MHKLTQASSRSVVTRCPRKQVSIELHLPYLRSCCQRPTLWLVAYHHQHTVAIDTSSSTMAPGVQVDRTQTSWAAHPTDAPQYTGPPRNVESINAVQFDKSLQPKKYEIKGTSPDSKILLTDVNILDSTGKEPYRGDVFIEGMYPLLFPALLVKRSPFPRSLDSLVPAHYAVP